MASLEVKFSAKDLKQAAKLQEQLVTQIGLLGYQLSEFKAIPNKSKIEVTLTLVAKKKS